MNILFLFQNFNFQTETIYSDLLKALVRHGHDVTVVAGTTQPLDESIIHWEHGCELIYVHLPNQFGTSKFKKGLIQLLIEPRMLFQLMRHLRGRHFDAVIYPTPPITLANIVQYCRKTFGARSYLMLKDIFPQNAVDLGMMRNRGFLHRYFRTLERRLYKNSDFIGCMSPANFDYMRQHLSKADAAKLELFPNTVELIEPKPMAPQKDGVTRFMLGGNLGKPQAIDFFLNCLLKLKNETRARFVIIGSGSEAASVREFITQHRLDNAEFHAHLPREEYEQRLAECDVGLILLNPAFTIPNYPSRLLSYMRLKKPILAATDKVTDIRELIESDACCGLWCPSADTEAFVKHVQFICDHREVLTRYGENGHAYFVRHFSVERSVRILEQHFSECASI